MRIKKWSGLYVALLGVQVIALDGAYAQVVPSIERVSVGDSGQQVGPVTFLASMVRMSVDGNRVLFESSDSLVSDDLNASRDGFVRIRSSQTTERVTLQADGSEFAPTSPHRVFDMSSNGQFVLFNLASLIEPNPKSEVIVRDVVTGETGVVTSSAGFMGQVSEATVSDDGDIIAFVSASSDLVPGDTNRRDDVFVHDRSKGETTLLRAPGTPRWWGGDQPDITPDGRYVVFQAYESIYRVDLWTDEYELVSVSTGFDPQSYQDRSQDPVISADGRFVAYTSRFVNDQILLRDMTQERSVLVTAGSEGVGPGEGKPSISADGRFIVFISRATDLGPDVSGGTGYIYLFDAVDGAISLVSRDEDGKPIAGIGSPAYISGDGSTVVFTSNASDLVPGDTNDAFDVFTISLTIERCAGMVVTIAGSGEIIGTDGDDVILASAGPDSIDTGAGDDIICALDGGDVIDAGAGNDVVYAGAGNDIIYAGNGRDLVFGGKDDDIVNAGAGNDRAFGGPGIDIIRGNEGADRLSGGPGDDTLIGGPGTDRLAGGDDVDICKGSAGPDRYFQCEERLP